MIIKYRSLISMISVNTLLSISYISVSCTHTNKVQLEPVADMDVQEHQPNKKSKTPPAPAAPEKEVFPSKRQMIKAVADLSELSISLTNEHRQVFYAMPINPPSGSIQEAVVVIGSLRIALAEADDQSSFKEGTIKEGATDNQSIAPKPASQNDAGQMSSKANGIALENAPPLSLEARLSQKNVNLAAAMQHNILLHNHNIYAMVSKVLNISKNSESFKKEIQQVITDEANQWIALIPKPPAPEPPPAAAVVQAPEPVAPPPVQPVVQQPDQLLQQAQQTAENGDYKTAVALVKKALVISPSYQPAKDKLKIFSNQAVRVLRQKAAQAFQNALPAHNPEAKGAFLTQARDYLEQAINEFPDADNLDTVRENLAVISKDLQKVDPSKAN